MKQDYEERVAALSEELHFYREVKCAEMRDLLASCREQLRDFEELNVKRNAVIEELERENGFFRSLVNQGRASMLTMSNNNSMGNNSTMFINSARTSLNPIPLSMH
jgi:hypothetical protein